MRLALLNVKTPPTDVKPLEHRSNLILLGFSYLLFFFPMLIPPLRVVFLLPILSLMAVTFSLTRVRIQCRSFSCMSPFLFLFLLSSFLLVFFSSFQSQSLLSEPPSCFRFLLFDLCSYSMSLVYMYVSVSLPFPSFHSLLGLHSAPPPCLVFSLSVKTPHPHLCPLHNHLQVCNPTIIRSVPDLSDAGGINSNTIAQAWP